jgi:uncharacterized protein YndB with AHSA1/START domain
MKQINFSITINAPRQKVWDTVMGKETYPVWTAAFSEGFAESSEAIGDWSQGSKMLFISATAEGQKEGMVSMIAENRQPEFLSINHIGFMKNGVEDTTSPEVLKWAGAYENYTFTEVEGGTKFDVELSVEDSFKEMFEEMWPKALAKLKEMCE